MQSWLPKKLQRKRYFKNDKQLKDPYNDEIGEEDPEGNVVSSLFDDVNNRHMPALDLDVPHTYVESSTTGHAHLYIDMPMSWDQYSRLLQLLGELGILEEGFVDMAMRRGMTQLRSPGNYKVNSDREEDIPF